MSREPVERLSEVLTNLHELNEQTSADSARSTLAEQIKVLRSVQSQMQMQLQLHDAQIAALREVIALLSGVAE